MFFKSLFFPDKKRHTAAEWFAALPTLETQRLILRPARMRDAHDMYDVCQDPEVARYCLWSAHRSIEDTKAYLHQLIWQYRHALPSSFVIVLKETGRVIGTIGIMEYSEEHACAELGYSLGREFWGCGYATEALQEILRFCFDELKTNRAEARHDADNPASGRVMIKCGMQYEGTQRQKVINKGSFRDVKLYAVLREDRGEHTSSEA